MLARFKCSQPLRRVAVLARSVVSVITPAEMVDTRRTALGEPALTLQQAVANLKAAVPSTRSPPVSHKHAAVLVPLFEAPDGHIHVILTQRSSKMNTHAGEVCLPGGKMEPGDADDVATALREANEELGIEPGSVQIIATMPPVLSKHLLSVTPVLATVPADLPMTPNPSEVSSFFSAPLAMFLEAGPGYSSKDVAWEGLPYRLHYWDYAYRGKNYLIWGLTAGILVVVAEKAFGRVASFQVHPPGAQPYTALAYEKGRLVFRGSHGAWAPASGSPSSAAVEGAVVTQVEAEAAVGDESAAEVGALEAKTNGTI